MNYFKNKLKKGSAILLSVAMLFTNINVNAFATNNSLSENNINTITTTSGDAIKVVTKSEPTQTSKISNTDIIETNTLNEFSEEVVTLNLEDDLNSTSTYATKRLLVTSDTSKFNMYNPISIISYGNLYVLTYDTEENTKSAYKSLSNDTSIISVEIDRIMETKENEEVSSENNSTTTEDTELKKYLNTLNPSKEIKVAILDTGINSNNELFKNRIVDLGINLSSSGEQNSILDDNGHGTEMAGIIANNTSDYVKLIPIKVANSEGKATVLNTYLGIQQAIENNVDIINISMTASKSVSSEILTTIIDEATQQGILVVVSAGNNGTDVSNITPANVDNAIVVSATNSDMSIAEYSNYGSTIDYSSYGNYNNKNGTSYATANVTGILANILSKNEDSSVLNQYVIDLGEDGFDKYFGNGFISLKQINFDLTQSEINNITPNPLNGDSELSTSSITSSDILEYKTNRFSSTYSNGYIKQTAPSSIGSKVQKIKWNNTDYEFYTGTNTTKDTECYLLYKNAAIQIDSSGKVQTLDLKIYFWSGNGQWYAHTDKQGVRGSNNTTTMEFHFYYPGTNQECNFQGVLKFGDLDTGEGVLLYRGYNKVYTTKTNSWLTYVPTGGNSSSTNNPFKHSGGAVYPYFFSEQFGNEDDNQGLWIEVNSTTSIPFQCEYGHIGGSLDVDLFYSGTKINYYVDGVKENTLYSASYGTHILANPIDITGTKTGYSYNNGWYTSSNYSGTKYAIGSQMNVDATEISLYTYSTPNTYTLTINPNGGTMLNSAGVSTTSYWTKSFTYGNNICYFSTGTEGYYNADYLAGSKPTRTGYTFTNWKITSGGGSIGQRLFSPWWDFDANYAGNVTITAQWTPNEYTITLDTQGGTLSGGNCPGTLQKILEVYDTKWGCTNSTTTTNNYWDGSNPSTGITMIKNGYTFGGFYTGTNGNGTLVIDKNGKIVVSNTFFTSNSTIYAKWIPNTYTLNLDSNGGSFKNPDGSQSLTTWSKSFTYYQSTCFAHMLTSMGDTNLNAVAKPTRTGYTFANWKLTSGGGTILEDSNGYWNFDGKYAGNVTVTAQWTANTNTPYLVKHWKQNVNDNNYTLAETENKTGTTATTITPPVKTYTGFTSPSAQTVTIAANGSTVVNYYYTRNSYTVTLNKGTGITSVTGNGTYKYGASVTVKATLLSNTTQYTYGWSNWSGTYSSTSQNYTFTMPAQNVTLTANGTRTLNSYLQTVKVRYQNADGSWGAYSNVINQNYNYGSTVSWSRNSDTTYKAASISYTVTGANTKYVDIYRNTHTVTLNKGTGIASVTGNGTYYYGQSVTINATLLTGYHWNNWTGSTTYSNISNTFTIDGNKTFTANALINSSKLVVNPNGGSWNGNSNSQSFTQNYNTTKSIPIPTRTGYTFIGWTRTNTYGSMSSLTSASTYTFGPTNNVTDTITAQWKANKYPQTIQVRFENVDGTFTAYETVLSEEREYDSIITWSRPADIVYQVASVSYKVSKTSETITKVDILRNRFTVTINKGTGIDSVTGNGTYRYGQTGSIIATPATGYHWKNWTGYASSTNNPYYLGEVKENRTYTANAIINTSTLIVNPNSGIWNGSSTSQKFTQKYNTTKNIAIPTKEGYSFTGWSKSNPFNGSMSTLTSTTTYTYGPEEDAEDTITANWKINQYTVTYIDVIDSTLGKELGRTTKQVNFNSTVKGSDIGSSTTDNTYYNGYYYNSCTSAIVTTNGATVYRIFKLRTIDVSGQIIWDDKNNKTGSRPDSVVLHISSSDGNKYDITIKGDNTKNTNINNWDYSKTLPKYDENGKVLTYTISQDKVKSKEEGIKYLDPVVNGFDITNIATDDIDEGTDIPIQINWNDNNNIHGFRPKTITINLLQNGTIINTIEIKTTDNTYTFANLPIYDDNFDAYKYTLTSNEVDRYNKVIDNKTYTITYGFQEPVFSIVIPKTVILDGETGIGEYKVTVKGIIDNRDNITVIPERSFILRNDYLSDVIATVKQSKNTFTNADDLVNGTFATGTVKANTLAGEWSGDFNFKIKFNFGS